MSNDEKRPEDTPTDEGVADSEALEIENTRWQRPGASEPEEPGPDEGSSTDAALEATAAADGVDAVDDDRPDPSDPPDTGEGLAEANSSGELDDAENTDASASGEDRASGDDQEASSAADASDAEPREEPAPAQGKGGGGRVLAALALLLALGAAGGAGYLYYELIVKQPFAKQYAPVETVQELARVERSVTQNTQTEADLATQLEAVQAALASLDEAQAARAAELESSVEAAVGRVDRQLESQRDALEATEAQLLTNLNEVANRAPPTRAEWKVAEVEYLLRIANHRVLMEKDADGGLELLQTADAILAELDDFGFHQVRAQLAEEMLSLKRVGEVDAQGVYLRLEAVKRQLDGLPLKVPELLTRGATTTLAEDANLWDRILDQFTPYFAYRSELKTRIEPLLAPDEIAYLELNLRLMLEQAQLASLRAQQEIFEQSLDNAADWIRDYLNVDDPAVSQLVVELEELRDTSVLRDLPDISGSLRSLLATERGTS